MVRGGHYSDSDDTLTTGTDPLRRSASAVIARRPLTNKPKKTAAIVAQRIIDEIVDQDLEPGTPLVPEKEMVEKYGVARGTLREALRILETYGLITIRTGPGGGAVVADGGSTPLASVIALSLQLNRVPFRWVLDARAKLEPILAREAALRRTDGDLAQILRSIEAMMDAVTNADFAEQNRVFHAAVAEAAGNPIFVNIVGSLNLLQVSTAIGYDYPPDIRKAIIAAHRRIYTAIEARAAEMAEAAMRLHVGEWIGYAERHFAAILDRPLRWDQVDG